MVILLALACAVAPVEQTPAPPTLSPVRLAIRASLDLRGVRPSPDEIARIEADPQAYDQLVDEWLQDPRFPSRVMDHFSPIWLTRQDSWPVSASAYGITDTAGFAAAVGEEPLRMIAEIAANDLPWTEIVTADWTVSNEVLAQAWPVDYPSGSTGWQRVQYTDGRPAAGALATNSFWWRYMSNGSNANRARANAVSRVLLCEDFLVRPIEFDRNVNLLDEEAVRSAVSTNPSCLACHQALDPLASYLWGFYYYQADSALDATEWHPERERMWEDTTETAPGYFGEPGEGLEDLAWQIAADNRLAQCVTEQVFEALLQRDSTLADMDTLTAHRQALLDEGMTLRALFRSVVTSETYRLADGDDPLATPLKLASPELLASQIEALTGFRLEYAGYDLMTTDTYGLRTLAGGVDGGFVTRPAREPTATLALVLERLAQGAAHYVVEHDKLHPEEARLFTRIHFTERPDSEPDAMVAQLQDLHLLLFGARVAADGPEVQANLALWQDLYTIDHDPAAAWAGVLSVLLRDPNLLLY